MEEELKERLDIVLNYFLVAGEEFTIDYLKQTVELSGKIRNLLLKIHDFVQERVKEGLVSSTGKKERGGLFTVYRKKAPALEFLPDSAVSGAAGAGSPIGFHGNLFIAQILEKNKAIWENDF